MAKMTRSAIHHADMARETTITSSESIIISMMKKTLPGVGEEEGDIDVFLICLR